MNLVPGFQFDLPALAAQPQQPIFIKITGHPNEVTSLKDVVLGSLGLAGVIALLAILTGCALAGVLCWIRSRSA